MNFLRLGNSLEGTGTRENLVRGMAEGCENVEIADIFVEAVYALTRLARETSYAKVCLPPALCISEVLFSVEGLGKPEGAGYIVNWLDASGFFSQVHFLVSNNGDIVLLSVSNANNKMELSASAEGARNQGAHTNIAPVEIAKTMREFSVIVENLTQDGTTYTKGGSNDRRELLSECTVS